jgi:hypothetical protein
MTVTADSTQLVDGMRQFEPESPFAEALPDAGAPPPASETRGAVTWAESSSPFSEDGTGGPAGNTEAEELAEDIFESLQDEAFEEALTNLVGEVAELVDQRLVGETGAGLAMQRQALGNSHLAPIGFEAERYLEQLAGAVEGVDVASLSEAQLDELLSRYDPDPAGVTPAGEEFIRALARKAKGVVNAVKTVASKVVSPLLGPALRKLRGLVQPLLERVLALAINRLPAQFQEPARQLAKRFGIARAEAEEAYEEAAPVAVANTEALAEAFDAALTEFMLAGDGRIEQRETFGYEDETAAASDEGPLEALTEARGVFVDRLRDADAGEDLTPAIEQFLPALLPALRVAIQLIGRPKVVSWIAGYLAKAISRWVGAPLAAPLSRAIVETGLRLATLEQPEPSESEGELAPQVLAATIEDTVRTLAEQDEHVFEDEDLLGLALTEAFEQAVAANFPPELVRAELQIAPTLGGSFVVRAPRQAYAYKKFSRIPEVEVTAPIAQSIRTFGDQTLAAALQANGQSLPMRARVHIYEAKAGTSLPRLARRERIPGLDAQRRGAYRQLHPLTPEAAGILLREPNLGVAKPPYYLQTRMRIATGQRFYYLEPTTPGAVTLGAANAVAPRGELADAPTASSVTINLRRSELVFRLFFSETHAQAIAAAMRSARASAPLLRAVIGAYDDASRSLERHGGPVRLIKELEQEEVGLGAARRRVAPAVVHPLRRRIDRWARPMLAQWVRARNQEFVRAAQDPRPGVTLTLRLRGVPGLHLLGRAMSGGLGVRALHGVRSGEQFRGTPGGTVTVRAGRGIR